MASALPPPDADEAAGLTTEEHERYARQLGPGVLSLAGQQRLKQSAAFVTRAGGMGGPAALMLTMAGVGRVIIAHGGELRSPDLNRQVLGTEHGLDQPRAPRFGEYLRSMNRFVEIEVIDHEPDDRDAHAFAQRVDVMLSCAPTFEERLRLNSAAVAQGRSVDRCGSMGYDRYAHGAQARTHRVSPVRLSADAGVRRDVPGCRCDQRGDRIAGGPRGHQDPVWLRSADVG